VRLAKSRDDARALYAFLVACHLEIGRGEVEHGKAFATVLDVVENHTAIIVEDEDGKLVGSTGLQQYQVWYGHEWEIGDIWFFVSREHRGSEVARLMTEECAGIAEATGLPVILVINNVTPPGRRRLEPLGRIVHIEKRGHTLRMNP
jgi:hypothetical protein